MRDIKDKADLIASLQIDEEPSLIVGPVDEHNPGLVNTDNIKRGGAFSNVKRELTEEELKSPGAMRMLLSKIDDYDNCQKELKEYTEKFHQRDKECAILETAAKGNTAFEIVYSALLTFGSVLIGLYSSIPSNDTSRYVPTIILCVGIAAFLGGIAAKLFRHKQS